LVFEIDWLVDQLIEEARTEREARPIEHIRTIVMPRLDGSGSLLSELDADHFTPMVQRMDNHAADRFGLDATPDPADPDTDDVALNSADRHAAAMGRRNAVRRGLALFELVTGWDADTLTPLDLDDTARASGRPSLRVTCQLDTLLDGMVPGWVLSGMAGRIRVTSDTVRRWVDVHGADCRLVVLDDVGEIVGVGRKARFAPDWLREAVMARDLHDTAPCSTTPAMHCHVDHVKDWEVGGRSAWSSERSEELQRVRRTHVDKPRAAVGPVEPGQTPRRLDPATPSRRHPDLDRRVRLHHPPTETTPHPPPRRPPTTPRPATTRDRSQPLTSHNTRMGDVCLT